MTYISSLSELSQADLLLAGGKATNLGVLIRAGLPVPPGFCITTDAYRAFVAANDLEALILRLIRSARVDDPQSLDAVSTQIRTAFTAGQIPDDLAVAIRSAYLALEGEPSQAVAVRSSATAEDLPDMSFAGQQDTYLHIVGVETLLQAVVRCWGSLWTARAIGYRARNGIPPEQIALAVAVQVMVPSEASGVLFTANPLTGNRTESVIEATLGLGEALVSGQVEPDQYVFDTLNRRIASKRLGAKAVSIRGQSAGGTVTVAETAADRQALPDEAILQLAQLGQDAACIFQAPQDIEWAWAAGKLYLVQSRPITSLFPLPPEIATVSADSEAPFRLFFSFGVWQGMLDPMTPLGRDTFIRIAQSFARTLGLSGGNSQTFAIAAERMFINLSGLARFALGRAFSKIFAAALDPTMGSTLERLVADPRLTRPGSRVRLRTVLSVGRRVLPVVGYAVSNQLWPVRGRVRLQHKIDALVNTLHVRSTSATTLAGSLTLTQEAFRQLPPVLLAPMLGAVIPGMASLQWLLRLASGLPDGSQLVMELTRALPHNVTTEMDLSLWAVACAIKADPAAAARFAELDPQALAAEYTAGALPRAAQAAIANFMQQYGMRGVAEIDMGRPRWRENPAQIIQVLKSYLQIEDSALSPGTIFQRGATNAHAAEGKLIAALRRTPRGWFKAPLARWIVKRVRELAGLRETPKFTIMRLMGVLRNSLLDSGRKLAADGVLAQVDDVFFLHVSELESLASSERQDWRALVAERRQTYEREKRRQRIPRLFLSDGTAFYEGAADDTANAGANVLVGSPVSAGVAEGLVHVILDPHGTQLKPGEILVCPATDPAWTPLFLAAGGLVMEVGGMMTHGSVVAREYGIPAVVGVAQATTRLKTGQRIRVDGLTGHILLLDGNGSAGETSDRDDSSRGLE